MNIAGFFKDENQVGIDHHLVLKLDANTLNLLVATSIDLFQRVDVFQ